MTRWHSGGRVAFLLALVIGALPVVARAQCADGSPPPCRAQTVAQATPRRVNPPLDDRTWIVVPFDNLAKNSEVDWLRGASVNLLYLDMSRWRDIRVIDDERVADLLREVPGAGSAPSINLNAGIAVAKRAGAGKLVMGDVLKVGSRTAVTAKVFDVRSGQRVRSVREETAVQDSVMPLFSKLAQKILDVAPPQGANVGSLGTARVDAYQEYIAGVEALNHFDVVEARRRLEKALKLDSTFALAHYKMSIVIGWDDSSDRAALRAHAEAAGQLASGLPARERALIAAQLSHARGDEGPACDAYANLIRADSTDVEAWYGLGECSYHDAIVEAVGGDTTRMRFRGDWNRSIRAFERVLRLDPTYHLAYQHIIDVLTAERHANGCYLAEPTARCAPYGAFLLRSGDSLLATPLALPRDSAALRVQAEEYVRSSARRRSLQLANAAAQSWVQVSPAEPRARGALARVLLLQGRTAEAEAEVARIKPRTLTDFLRLVLLRMEIPYKIGRGGEAVRLYDSVRTHDVPLPAGSGTPMLGNAIASFGPAFGRLAEFDSVLSVRARLTNAAEDAKKYQRAAFYAVLGSPPDTLAALERAFFDQTSTRGVNLATRSIGFSLLWALRAPRTSWPAIDTTLRDPRYQPALALARGDTARLRRSARAIDSILSALTIAGGSDSGFAVIAADAYLILRDSVAALRVLRRALDSTLATTTLFSAQVPILPSVFLVPRMMLLRADLAAAAGQRDEARTWYTRFIDVWSTASPELQPMVARARKTLISLGGP